MWSCRFVNAKRTTKKQFPIELDEKIIPTLVKQWYKEHVRNTLTYCCLTAYVKRSFVFRE